QRLSTSFGPCSVRMLHEPGDPDGDSDGDEQRTRGLRLLELRRWTRHESDYLMARHVEGWKRARHLIGASGRGGAERDGQHERPCDCADACHAHPRRNGWRSLPLLSHGPMIHSVEHEALSLELK